jgi:hypothetical protein
MTRQEAETRCRCAGDKDDCHGCDPWPDADAALSQPEPQGPIPEAELAAMWNQQADSFNQWESLDSGEQLAWAQARALARWGRPAVKPEPQGPTLADEAYVAFVQICKGNSDDAGTYEADEELVRRALKRLSDLERRPAIEPVSVAERPPRPEDFHPENDWCWGWYGWRWRMMDSTCFYPGCNASHYVPHWALPVPQQEAGQ